MAITLNYNGLEIATTETDAHSIREDLLAALETQTPTMFRVRTADGAAFLLVSASTSLVVFESPATEADVLVYPEIAPDAEGNV